MSPNEHDFERNDNREMGPNGVLRRSGPLVSFGFLIFLLTNRCIFLSRPTHRDEHDIASLGGPGDDVRDRDVASFGPTA